VTIDETAIEPDFPPGYVRSWEESEGWEETDYPPDPYEPDTTGRDGLLLPPTHRRAVEQFPHRVDGLNGYEWPDEEPPGPHTPEAPVEEPTIPGAVPEAFWNARPELQHIRQAARAYVNSPDVALWTVLTRLSGMVSPHVRADTGVASPASLNLFVGLVGASGTGKSTGKRAARALMTSPIGLDFRDGLPIGSGEGMAEVYMGWKKEEDEDRAVRGVVRHNAFFYVDEGATLTQLMDRSGSTLGETLRSAAAGQDLGQTNAMKETSRFVPGGEYSMGLLVGFQPETAAPMFSDLNVAAGTPQRFVWGQVYDPGAGDTQPDWPGPLRGWEIGCKPTTTTMITFPGDIRQQLYEQRVRTLRGPAASGADEPQPNPLDSQKMITLIKLSALLAIIGGRLKVNADDWLLAEILWQASCEVRESVIVRAERQRAEEWRRAVDRQAAAAVAIEQAKETDADDRADRAIARAAKRIAAFTHSATEPLTRKQLRGRFKGVEKRFVTPGIEQAEALGWVLIREDRIIPGPVKPDP
jgi:hypothetical protein